MDGGMGRGGGPQIMEMEMDMGPMAMDMGP